MSLLVWLPLNGDFTNQGLLELPAPTINTYTYTDGKIGQCGKGRAGWHLSTEILGNQWTVATWINCDGTFGQYNNVIFCKNIKTSSDNQIYLSIINNTQLNVGVNGPSSTISYGYTFSTNTWYHVAATYDGLNVRLYLNGELVKSGTTATAQPTGTLNMQIDGRSSNDEGTSSTAGINMKYNDFRLYDHALSTTEVHELAQGLILHYKFDDPYIESTVNIAPNPYAASYSSYSPNWDTTKHPNAISVPGWNTGYNGGVTNPNIGYHGMWNLIDNIPTFILQNHNSEINQAYRWLGVNSSELSGSFTAGTKYTLSWEQKTLDTLGAYTTGGRHYKTTSSGSNGFHDGCPKIGQNTKLNVWERFSHTFTVTNTVDGTGTNGVLYIYSYFSPESTIWVRNVQLEIKDHMTPYTQNTREGTNIIEDSSGYGYNGNVTSTINNTADTSRHSLSINYADNTGSIEVPTMPMNIFNSGNTVAFWIKPQGENGNRSVYCSSYSGESYSIEKTANNKLRVWWAGSPDVYASTLTIEDNVWQHIAVVKAENKGSLILYKNGQYIETIANTFSDKSWSGTYRLGRDYRTDATAYVGQMSDFRVYCTPLLDNDIKLLYNTSVKINKLGGLHTFSINETQANEITKTGLLNTSQVCENARMQYLKYDNELYFEPDGSVWVHVFHHNNPAGGAFGDIGTTAPNSVYINQDRWFNVQVADQLSSWEILVKTKMTPSSEEEKYRWIQPANPMTCAYTDVTRDKVTWITTDGYINRIAGWGGLFKKKVSAYLAMDNNTNGGNWWGAVGAYSVYQGGIPGFSNGITTTGYLDLYLRVDNQNFTDLSAAMNSKYNMWLSPNFIES